LFESEVVSNLPAPKEIISIDSKQSLVESFEVLLDNNILSAPVYDKESHEYIGFLDVRDLISFVVFVFDEQKVTDNTRLKDLILHGANQFKMKSTDGVTCSYLARRNRFLPVKGDQSIRSVVEILSQGHHRVPVMGEGGKVINVISQSTIIKFVTAKLPDAVISPVPSDAIISNARIGTSPVLTVQKSTSVISTFREMDKKKRSGIALVDETGRLVGTTTGKDLGLFLSNPTLAALNMPIFDYLREVRSKQIDIKTPAIAVFGSDSVTRAAGLIAATSVHRVFVVDNEKNYKPIRAISITDLLNWFLRG
jgi:CBS domain-containing protein